MRTLVKNNRDLRDTLEAALTHHFDARKVLVSSEGEVALSTKQTLLALNEDDMQVFLESTTDEEFWMSTFQAASTVYPPKRAWINTLLFCNKYLHTPREFIESMYPLCGSPFDDVAPKKDIVPETLAGFRARIELLKELQRQIDDLRDRIRIAPTPRLKQLLTDKEERYERYLSPVQHKRIRFTGTESAVNA